MAGRYRSFIGKKITKEIKPTTEGKCPYCNKHVKALEAHIHDEHLGKKMPK